jgi:peptidoglycan/LPS O-acetylase OafA/YrhL
MTWRTPHVSGESARIAPCILVPVKRDTSTSLLATDPRRGSIESTTYYPWFDWLRAACASVVVLHHDRAFTWPHTANFAVLVFFALSGWLIGGILLDKQPRDMPRFYFNRALRIWVPYYFAVLLLLSLAVWRDPITSKWLEIVSYKLTFVYNVFGTRQIEEFGKAMPESGTLTHVWSVNAEEQFYLLAPLLLVLAGRRSPAVWSVIALAALVWQPLYAAIVFGVLAATIARRYGALHLTATGRAVLFAMLAAGSTAMVFGPYQVVAPFAAISIVLLLASTGRQHVGGALFGGMSYPLYLNHWVAIYTLNALHLSGPVRHGLVLVLAIAVACVMYWWIDRPVLAARARLYTPRRGGVLTACAYGTVAVGATLGLILWR